MAVDGIIQLFTLLALLLLRTPPVEGAEADKDALLALKSRISNPGALFSWDPAHPSPCNWTGVACDHSIGRVVSLDLSGLGLRGSIAPSVANLSFLQSLQIQQNQLEGPIPDEIGRLLRLRALNLSSNRVQGPIPSSMGRLNDLRTLDLMENQIHGRIPEEVSHLTRLRLLRLGKNRISGPIPPSLANLSSLTEINFGTNFITGTIPAGLARLRNLKQLDLTINNLTGTVPPSIYNMSSLVYIALASNQLWGNIPSNVGDTLPNLLGFNFCFNLFTGAIPASLHNLTRIRIIRMAHNFLQGTVPPGLGSLPELRMYNIGFNKLINSPAAGLTFVESLRNSTRLNFLAIDGNRFVGQIPESIGELSGYLTHLYMGGNLISGRIPPSIGRLSGLTLLNLSYNSISGEIPPEIGLLEGLQSLILAGNRISGGLPESIGNLRKLNLIDINGNELGGRIPASFGNFKGMLSMDLSNNRFNGSIPRETFNLPSLSTVLNLSKNSFTGSLPLEVQILQSVVEIDVSDNDLSGEIPMSFGHCKSLERLSMARNSLSGPIPATLTTVKGLESLDLSSNQLSGSIPDDLQNLNALRRLNLSFNHLQGDVPSGGIFSNLSGVQLQGNPKLCLHSNCWKSRSHAAKRAWVIVLATVVPILALGLMICWQLRLKKSGAKVARAPESFKGQRQTLSYQDLWLATSHFSDETLIGRGSFGSVYKGCLQTGGALAIKVLDAGVTKSRKCFAAECQALRNVRHRNLVKLITSCSSLDFKGDDFLALVYEFVSRGNLEEWIDGRRRHPSGDRLNVMERLNVAIDVAYGLDYLHHDGEAPVVHCDIKPSNILLDEDISAKVGDFGLARLVMENRSGPPSSTIGLRGSMGYIAPEYGIGEKPSTAGDVYSYGVMLLQVFTGKSPLDESFKEGLSLTKWVQSAFPADPLRAVDPELLPLMDKPTHIHGGTQTISPAAQKECVAAIIGVGLACTAHSAASRITIREALRRLVAARGTICKAKAGSYGKEGQSTGNL